MRSSSMVEMAERTKPVALVVEDETLLRIHATDLLEQHGLSVVQARNAEEVIRIMEAHDAVRLLFTDSQMPGRFDGMDLARQVHARLPHVLMVITSGQKKPAQREIPDDGRFIGEPYRPAELLDQVDDSLRKPRSNLERPADRGSIG